MLKTKISYLLLFLTVLFVGCEKKEEKKVETLTINFQEGDLPSLHPHAIMIYLRGISIGKSLYEGLTRIDENGKANLAGADSVNVTADGLQYSFSLRPNFWSDGTKVTATDYENAWKNALSPTANCPRADLLYMIKNAEKAKKGEVESHLIGVKALDETTLLVNLEYPSPHFLELLAQPICAPLKDIAENEPTQFNGPFQLDVWKHGDYLQLKKNPHYWNQRQVALEKIRIYMVQDIMTAFTMFEKKQIEWIGVPFSPMTAEMITHLTQQNALSYQPVNRAFWIFLNTQHPSLSSSHIRQALNLSFDRKAITDHIFSHNQPLNKPLPSALLDSEPFLDLQKNLIVANEELDKGLEELNVTRETLPPLILAYSPQAGRKQLAEFLQQEWSKGLGIEVQLEPQEWNIFRVNLGNGNYQISGSFEAPIYNDPLELLQKFVTLGPNNFPQWKNSEFIEIVNAARNEIDVEQRFVSLADAEQILSEEVPFIPVCSDKFVFSHTNGLKGFVFDCVGACDLSYAYIDK